MPFLDWSEPLNKSIWPYCINIFNQRAYNAREMCKNYMRWWELEYMNSSCPHSLCLNSFLIKLWFYSHILKIFMSFEQKPGDLSAHMTSRRLPFPLWLRHGKTFSIYRMNFWSHFYGVVFHTKKNSNACAVLLFYLTNSLSLNCHPSIGMHLAEKVLRLRIDFLALHLKFV